MYANLTDIIESMSMLSPLWFYLSVVPGLPSSVAITYLLNISLVCCMVGIVSILAFITCGTAVADRDLVTVRPEASCVVPGCDCGFFVIGATATPSTAASPQGEVGDNGKETGDLGVARLKGGREGRVGYDKLLNRVVILDGGVC